MQVMCLPLVFGCASSCISHEAYKAWHFLLTGALLLRGNPRAETGQRIAGRYDPQWKVFFSGEVV